MFDYRRVGWKSVCHVYFHVQRENKKSMRWPHDKGFCVVPFRRQNMITIDNLLVSQLFGQSPWPMLDACCFFFFNVFFWKWVKRFNRLTILWWHQCHGHPRQISVDIWNPVAAPWSSTASCCHITTAGNGESVWWKGNTWMELWGPTWCDSWFMKPMNK